MRPPETDPEFEALLDYLKHNRGCDLTGYKRSTLMRRFQHRMYSVQVDHYRSYLQYLQTHSEEYLALLNDVLINFTGFFRDQAVWNYLASEILPRIIDSKQPDEPIRVWSAGCAAGQEIYSILVLLAEALGIEPCLKRVQCFATDADEDALRRARQGTYTPLEITNIPPDLLAKYFQQTSQGYVFHPALRRTIVFGHHDLTKNAPMSKIDLLLCRNVLIYFTLETQVSILVRFHFALKNSGFLVLGRSETLANRRQIFTPIHSKHRVYAKGLDLELEDHLSITPKSRKSQSVDRVPVQQCFWKTAFETSPVAQFMIDRNGRLIEANEQAMLLFGLTLDDGNRLFQTLEPGKLIAASTSAKAAYSSRRLVRLKNIEWNTSQGLQHFDVVIAPVFNAQNQFLGNTLTFLEKSNCKQLVEKLAHSEAELERVSEKMQATEAELDEIHQAIQLFNGNMLYKD